MDLSLSPLASGKTKCHYLTKGMSYGCWVAWLSDSHREILFNSSQHHNYDDASASQRVQHLPRPAASILIPICE